MCVATEEGEGAQAQAARDVRNPVPLTHSIGISVGEDGKASRRVARCPCRPARAVRSARAISEKYSNSVIIVKLYTRQSAAHSTKANEKP